MSENDITTYDSNTNDLSNIYRQISIEPDMLFDENEEKQYLVDCIEKVYSPKFLLIENTELMDNKDQLNTSFVQLIKYCVGDKKPYNSIHKLFIEYCDYFSLPYNKCFLLLHQKIQNIIIAQTKIMIGRSKFNKIDKINNPFKVFTLFDLLKK